MSKLQIEIADLESILANHADEHDPDELALMEEDLEQYRYLQGLWEQYEAVPKSDDGLSMLAPFRPYGPDGIPSTTERSFEAGAPVGDVLSWFQSRFCVDVREDLGYDGPWDREPAAVPQDGAPSPEQIAAVGMLSAAQKEYVYAAIRMERLVEDAKAHAEALLAEDPELLGALSEESYQAMARAFLDGHDPSRADDEQWDEIIWDIANRDAEKGSD